MPEDEKETKTEGEPKEKTSAKETTETTERESKGSEESGFKARLKRKDEAHSAEIEQVKADHKAEMEQRDAKLRKAFGGDDEDQTTDELEAKLTKSEARTNRVLKLGAFTTAVTKAGLTIDAADAFTLLQKTEVAGMTIGEGDRVAGADEVVEKLKERIPNLFGETEKKSVGSSTSTDDEAKDGEEELDLDSIRGNPAAIRKNRTSLLRGLKETLSRKQR